MEDKALLGITGSMARRQAGRRLAVLTRRLEFKPWNRPGADKSFVFGVLRQYLAYLRALRP